MTMPQQDAARVDASLTFPCHRVTTRDADDIANRRWRLKELPYQDGKD